MVLPPHLVNSESEHGTFSVRQYDAFADILSLNSSHYFNHNYCPHLKLPRLGS